MTGRRLNDSSLPDPDYCLYSTETFLPLLMQLEAELQGVVRDDDIEYVHRCRVATRRIRAAFSLFSECFPPSLLRNWEKKIRILTRSLGEARDLDVQIEYVQSFLIDRTGDKESAQSFFSLPDHQVSSIISHVPTTLVAMAPEKEPCKPRSLRSRFSCWMMKHQFFANVDDRKGTEDDIQATQYTNETLCLHDDSALAGLECLLLRLIQKRRVMQPDVSAVVTECMECGVIEEMVGFLHELKVRSMLRGDGVHSVYSYEQAFMNIMVRVADLFWFEPYLTDSTRIHQHHEMRIAAKRLRYTLEAYANLFDDHLKNEIKAIKKIQEFLGDIHDCDVWTSFLPEFLHQEEGRSVAYFGNHRFFALVQPGISLLMEERKESRGRIFEEFCRYWGKLKKEEFWELFSEKISVPMQSSFSGEVGTAKGGTLSIALISDVHANLPALEAVLADAESKGASVVLNAGDMTGYGPFPDEVVSLIRSRHILSVIGNYDQSVLQKKWKSKKPRSREKKVAMRWAYHNLSRENRVWLLRLPREIRLSVRGISLMVTHGSPDSITEYLDNGTPESRFLEIASGIGARIVVSGHSHRPAAREIGGVWFVNPGSVGRSEDGDPRACYALITVEPFSLTHIRIPYDVERTVSAIRKRHLPDSFARIVKEGRPLEMVRDTDT